MVAPVNGRVTIAQRRALVAQNLLAGMHYREIAEGLGYSVGTIASDVKYLLKTWHESAMSSIGAKTLIAEQQLNAIVNAHWEAALTGKKPRDSEIVLKALDQKAKLLGLNAERAVTFNFDLTKLSDAEIEQLASGHAPRLLGAGQ